MVGARIYCRKPKPSELLAATNKSRSSLGTARSDAVLGSINFRTIATSVLFADPCLPDYGKHGIWAAPAQRRQHPRDNQCELCRIIIGTPDIEQVTQAVYTSATCRQREWAAFRPTDEKANRRVVYYLPTVPADFYDAHVHRTDLDKFSRRGLPPAPRRCAVVHQNWLVPL